MLIYRPRGVTSGWIALPLQNSWVAFSAAYSTPLYRMIDGMVEITGLIKSGSTTATTPFATLPVGFRPAERRMSFGVNSSNAAHRVDLATDGTLFPQLALPGNAYFCLDNIRFRLT